MKPVRFLLVLPFLGLVALAAASDVGPPGPRNAALRYWMAFSLMDNQAADDELAGRIDRIAGGAEPWDERVTVVVDRNHDALVTMHRGTRLPWCDWAIELDLLAEAPMGHLSRARALARLNVLYGMRLAQQGRTADALDAWLAGVRFSRDIASGGTYLSALVAGQALSIHLRAIAQMVKDRRPDVASLAKVAHSLGEMPESGLDWGAAGENEIGVLSAFMKAAEDADDPAGYLAKYFPPPEGKADPSALARSLGLSESQLGDQAHVRAILGQARALCDDLRPQLATALRAPYPGSVEIVRALDVRASANPVTALGWPSASRLNTRREEVIRARSEVLALLQK